MSSLIVLVGPIGAGKSSVAAGIARALARSGCSTANADLDDLAFAQIGGGLTLEEFWRRAGAAHKSVVRAWFEAGVDVVIAHGPFFESGSYTDLFDARPSGSRLLHVLLTVDTDTALDRVRSDPERGPGALSTNEDFLRLTHQQFEQHVLPETDLVIDTSDLGVDDVVELIASKVLAHEQQKRPGALH